MENIEFDVICANIWVGKCTTHCLEDTLTHERISAGKASVILLGNVKCVNCDSHLLDEDDYMIILQHEIVEGICLVISDYDFRDPNDLNTVMHKITPVISPKECCGRMYDCTRKNIL